MKRILLIFVLASTCWGQFNGTKPILGEQIDWSHPLASGLVGCWLMNEGSGSTVQDLSGNGKHGTLGATTWAAGKFGSCLGFDGGDTINITGFSLSGSYTWSFWVCSTDTTANTDLFDCQTGRMIVLWRQSDMLTLYDGNYRYFGSTPSSGWHHVVFVASATTLTCSCYMDGVQSGITRTYTPVNIGGSVAIGSRYSGDDNYFNGLMSSCAIYNRALSASEIAQLYREPFGMIVQDRPELYVTAEAPAGGGQFIMVSRAAVPFLIPLGVIVGMAWCMRKKKERKL